MSHREFAFQSASPSEQQPVKDLAEKEQEQQHEAWINRIHDLVIQEYPFLTNVNLSVLFLNPEKHDAEIRAAYLTPRSFRHERVGVDLGDETHLKKLKQDRKISFGINAEMLGIKPEHMTAELFSTFMLLHEFGHAHDFQTNYAQSEDLQDVSDDDIAIQWRHNYLQQEAELPVPHVGVANLLRELKTKPLQQMLDEDPELRARLEALHLSTEEEILEAQDRAYRNMPAEKYADAFATNFIKTHLPEIIADIEGAN